MPIVKPRAQDNSPETRAMEAMVRRPTSFGVEVEPTELLDLPDNRNVLERARDFNDGILSVTRDPDNLFNIHLRRSGVVSGLYSENMVHRIQGISISQLPDPNFNPYDLLDDDFKDQHPYLQEHFASGAVLDLPNEEAFWHWANRVKADYEDREKMAEYGLATNIIAGIPAIAIDTLTAGAALRAFGLGNTATQLADWTRRGSFLSRTGKMGVTAGALNLAQEELLRLNNPDRNVDETEAAAMAFGMGLAFGSAVPAFVKAKQGVSLRMSERQIARIQSDTVDYFALPQARDAEELIQMSRESLQKMLDEGGDPPASISAVITDETRPLIDALAEKYPGVEIVQHPDQANVDWLVQLRRVEKMSKDALPADGTNKLTTEYAKLLSMFAPGARVRGSLSSLARRASRTLWDDTTLTRESLEAPVSNVANSPAEALRWNLDAKMLEMRIGLERHLNDALASRGARIEYSFADGRTMSFGRKDIDAYGRAVTDYRRRVDTARRLGRELPDAPEAVRAAASDVDKYFKFMGEEAISARFLHEDLGELAHNPQRWKWFEVQRNKKVWIDKIYAQTLKYREIDYSTGKPLTETDRSVLDEVVDFKRDTRDLGRGLDADDRRAIRDLIEKYKEIDPDKALTEAEMRVDLGDDIMRRYNEEWDLWARGSVESTYETLVNIDNAHGVTHAMGSNAFKRRLLQIDQDEFSEFLVESLEDLVGGYHTQVAGRIAARQAIRNDALLVSDLKALGFDLEKADYDPNLLIAAVRKDFDDQMAVARGAGDMKNVDRLEASQRSTLNVLQAKLDELQGESLRINDPAASAGWRLFEKVSLRLPAMAFLGKVTVSSLTDLAAHAFTKGLTARHIKGTARSINLLKSVPDYGLEGLYVANSDMIRPTRALHNYDLDNLGEMRQYGVGRTARVLETFDKVSEAVQNTFFKLTGMNRWNRNQKRWMSTLYLFEFMRGAKKMAQAERLVRSGLSEADAIKKVGLDLQDAALLNRLGLNGARSDRLMRIVSEHGAAFDLKDGAKKKWANQAEFERFLEGEKGYVSPEFYAWKDLDRELFNTFTGAINRHVQDLIVEPKMMSRPLFNNTWIGRVFNQFQAFAFAWGNQHAHLAAQRPVHEQVGAIFLGVGVAGLVDAIHNQLSGRRSFDETAVQWAENPQGMVYGAINRSALTGWLVRPIGLLDQTPIGPGKLLGNNELSGTYSRPIEPSGFLLGPFGSWADNSAVAIMQSAYEGEVNNKRKRQLWNALPYHNLWFIEAAMRTAEAMDINTPQFTKPAARQ